MDNNILIYYTTRHVNRNLKVLEQLFAKANIEDIRYIGKLIPDGDNNTNTVFIEQPPNRDYYNLEPLPLQLKRHG